MPAYVTEFKGQPMLELTRNEDDRYPFTFGLGKAKLIVEHIEDIQDFVVQHALANGKKSTKKGKKAK